MANIIALGVQWLVDEVTGKIAGYRRVIGGRDEEFTEFDASFVGATGDGSTTYEDVTTTTYTGPNVNENASVFLFPRTANAAGALATTYASISRVAGGNTVTITHANAATTDRTFSIAILGG